MFEGGEMETKSSNLSVLLEEGVKRGRVKMDIETEIRYDEDDGEGHVDHNHDDEHDKLRWTQKQKLGKERDIIYTLRI